MSFRLYPYLLVRTERGYLREVISRPFPEKLIRPGVGEVEEESVMVREPGLPTTITRVAVAGLSWVRAVCPGDGHEFVPVLEGEFKSTRIKCPKCGREYFAQYGSRGVDADRFAVKGFSESFLFGGSLPLGFVAEMGGSAWKRYIAVEVSPRKSVICEPAFQDWHYKVCTLPLDHGDAWKMCERMNATKEGEWSQEVLDAVAGVRPLTVQ